ncbi:hypothetical protein CYMTET_44552 [Cymbomonas tetramitiformis]|uniref:Uncharacterized protein n=1 Tax=Cymbomonas tetramitiformis TaxID=36881 RepID=A0AAE0C185_9CHLO|nr:hypothetical protein CYMTET_44552 [Cymbomonas tetramitiformis]
MAALTDLEVNHLADIDGVAVELFHYLWMKNSFGRSCPGLHLAETVVFKQSKPCYWFFTSAQDKQIKRKNRTNVVSHNVFENFIKKKAAYSSVDVCGYTLVTNMLDEVLTRENQETARTEVEYYDNLGLKNYLFYGEKPTTVKLTDKTHELYERCVTFEGPERHSDSSPLTGSALAKSIQTLCNEIVNHVRQVSGNVHNITRMVCNFKMDPDGRVWFLWCSSLRLVPAGAEEAGEPPRSAPINLNPKFLIKPQSKLIVQAKQGTPVMKNVSFRCPYCLEINDMRYKYEVTYKSIIAQWQKDQSKEQRNRERAAEANGDVPDLLQDAKSPNVVPPVIRACEPRITSEKFIELRSDPTFLYRNAQLCEGCCLVHNSSTLDGLDQENPRMSLEPGSVVARPSSAHKASSPGGAERPLPTVTDLTRIDERVEMAEPHHPTPVSLRPKSSPSKLLGKPASAPDRSRPQSATRAETIGSPVKGFVPGSRVRPPSAPVTRTKATSATKADMPKRPASAHTPNTAPPQSPAARYIKRAPSARPKSAKPAAIAEEDAEASPREPLYNVGSGFYSDFQTRMAAQGMNTLRPAPIPSTNTLRDVKSIYSKKQAVPADRPRLPSPRAGTGAGAGRGRSGGSARVAARGGRVNAAPGRGAGRGSRPSSSREAVLSGKQHRNPLEDLKASELTMSQEELVRQAVFSAAQLEPAEAPSYRVELGELDTLLDDLASESSGGSAAMAWGALLAQQDATDPAHDHHRQTPAASAEPSALDLLQPRRLNSDRDRQPYGIGMSQDLDVTGAGGGGYHRSLGETSARRGLDMDALVSKTGEDGLSPDMGPERTGGLGPHESGSETPQLSAAFTERVSRNDVVASSLTSEERAFLMSEMGDGIGESP